jgi:hypothetical protein
MIYEDMEYINKCLLEELPPLKTRKRRKVKTAYFVTREQSRKARNNRMRRNKQMAVQRVA